MSGENEPKDLTGRVRKITDLYFAYGGFSEVYKGIYRDESGLPRDVAIKVIRGLSPTESNKEAVFKRLNREALLWHKLKHPNVLEFFGVVHNMGSFFGLVSTYCEKGPVATYLDDNPQTDRLDLILGVAKGIEYLHEEGLIHGDIKGSNVLIADDGRPLLCDFGRSRIINHQGHTTTNPAGSLRYMAPELIVRDMEELDDSDYVERHVRFLTKATDVYAFSMLSVEILSGEQPYPKIRNEFRITFRVPEGLRPIREDYQLSVLHEKIWGILELCWVKDPAERLTISDVVQRLSNIG